jgi:uncharacterized membrane protein YccC
VDLSCFSPPLPAWIATCSPRLSYLGLQIAAAFCLMNLEEFKFQASLAVARDRVVGILLGLFVMWLAFDWLWSVPAGVEMKRTFVSAIRALAQLAREPVSSDIPRRSAVQVCQSSVAFRLCGPLSNPRWDLGYGGAAFSLVLAIQLERAAA